MRAARPGSGPRWRATWFQWHVTVLLLVAFSVLPLAGTEHGRTAAPTSQQHEIAQAQTQPCGHAHVSALKLDGLSDRCGGDAVEPNLVDCDAMCAVFGILVEARSADGPPAAAHLAGLRPDRLGQLPSGILRPPRLGVTA